MSEGQKRGNRGEGCERSKEGRKKQEETKKRIRES